MDFKWITDDIGPEKVVHIYDAKSGLKAIVVIDNTSLGPAIGGVRMASDVTAEEVFRLARAMTFKKILLQESLMAAANLEYSQTRKQKTRRRSSGSLHRQ